MPEIIEMSWIAVVLSLLTVLCPVAVWVVARKLDVHEATLVAEVMLVMVLGLEGVIAFGHLSSQKSDAQATRLMDLMRELGSDGFLEKGWAVANQIPLSGQDALKMGDAYQWELTDPSGVYAAKRPDGTEVQIRVNSDDPLWKAIHHVAERYQLAGFLASKNLIDSNDLFRWAHLPVIRYWRRFGGIVIEERTAKRRNSPHFWKYFQELAEAATVYDSNLRKGH